MAYKVIDEVINSQCLNNKYVSDYGTNNRLFKYDEEIINHINKVLTIDISSNETLIKKNAEFMIPEYLLININDRTKDDIIKNYNFVVMIGNQIMNYPLQMLEYLEQSSIVSTNTLKITINWEYFMNGYKYGLSLVSICYSDVKMFVKHCDTGDILTNVKLVAKYIYAGLEVRRRLGAAPRRYTAREVKTFQLQSITDMTPTHNVYKYNLTNVCNNGFINGFIVRLNNNDIEHLECIDISFTGIDDIFTQSLTQDMIKIYCQKLNANSIYVPLNFDTTIHSEFTITSFNLANYKIEIKFIFITTMQKFDATLYLIQPNKFNMSGGTGEYMYPLIDNNNNNVFSYIKSYFQ